MVDIYFLLDARSFLEIGTYFKRFQELLVQIFLILRTQEF